MTDERGCSMLDPNFPSSLKAFIATFGTEEACRDYLFKQKWPSGFVCARCGLNVAWEYKKRELWVCIGCQHQHSLRAGTLFAGSKKPLTEWFYAIWLVTTSKRGISAKELQRQLGFGSYQTAWSWLHKIRKILVVADRTKLQKDVEVDEAYVGAARSGKRGRGAGNKKIVVCAVENLGGRGACGRIRLGVVTRADRKTLVGFVKNNVEDGAIVVTDKWPAYRSLASDGYHHIAIECVGADAVRYLPRAHRIFSLMRRWLLGTHHGAVRQKHLQSYLEEFTFRFNRRKAKNFGHGFQRVLEQACGKPCLPYWRLVGRLAPKAALV